MPSLVLNGPKLKEKKVCVGGHFVMKIPQPEQRKHDLMKG